MDHTKLISILGLLRQLQYHTNGLRPTQFYEHILKNPELHEYLIRNPKLAINNLSCSDQSSKDIDEIIDKYESDDQIVIDDETTDFLETLSQFLETLL